MTAYGVDGCKGGWFFVALNGADTDFGVVPTIDALIERAPDEATVLIDMPIGLRESGDLERLCDLEARKALTPLRGTSVFPAPSRQAVYSNDYDEAQRRNREALGKGLSKQSWAIAPKIREVDELLRARPELRHRVREVHPEVCFWGLAGHPMQHAKRTREGFAERIALLEAHVPNAEELVQAALLAHGGYDAQRDDILDAMVAALCASRLAECSTLPEVPELDSFDLPMEMVYLRT